MEIMEFKKLDFKFKGEKYFIDKFQKVHEIREFNSYAYEYIVQEDIISDEDEDWYNYLPLNREILANIHSGGYDLEIYSLYIKTGRKDIFYAVTKEDNFYWIGLCKKREQ
ncbi:MAG: hypothetical protein H7A31_04570 [Thermotogae bacterium]|nr:hypothetical protein [Thermotogota bacterium]MCP5465952.1 hypothetical protein [Thermotogota bacterium]